MRNRYQAPAMYIPNVSGVAGATGATGSKGATGATGATGADGRDFDIDKSLALNAALALPAWLEKGENFSLSGGIGFSGGGETAIGVTGIVRIDGTVSGFVGGAI